MTRPPTPRSSTAWARALHFWAPVAVFSTRPSRWSGHALGLLYGERRTVTPVPGTRLASICGEAPFEGFHYCGYGLDERFASKLQDVGVLTSAHAADAGPEALELSEHPFFLATAFQPQVGSSQNGKLHPILSAWLQAAAGRASRR